MVILLMQGSDQDLRNALVQTIALTEPQLNQPKGPGSTTQSAAMVLDSSEITLAVRLPKSQVV